LEDNFASFSRTLVDIVAGEVAIVKGQEGPAAKECRKYGQGRFEDYYSQGSWPLKETKSDHSCQEIAFARRKDTRHAGWTPDG